MSGIVTDTQDILLATTDASDVVVETTMETPAERLEPVQPAQATTVALEITQPAEPSVEVSAFGVLTDRIDAAIQVWIQSHLANSPVSRSTDVWNHVTGCVTQLRDLIIREI